MAYIVSKGAEKHTCWDAPDWDGTMAAPGECVGCDQAAAHPCNFCGYGEVFTTHNVLAHSENGDTQVPDDPTDSWYGSPHIYTAVAA